MTPIVSTIADAIRDRRSCLVTSHARPDGDAVGSSVALALAIEATGREAIVVLKDPIPASFATLPEVDRIRIGPDGIPTADAVIVLECGDLERTGLAGLDAVGPIANIDHHPGNTGYGAWNWFDPGAAACGEMVAELIDALGVTWTRAMATHLYLALSTDTGSFRYGPVSARTFDICRRITEAGVDTSALSRTIYENYSVGRVRLTGALLDQMTLHHDQRLAVVVVDDALLTRCDATTDDLEGLVNLPLGAREILAVAMLKAQPNGEWRVSLRSKGAVDVRAVAAGWQGGGHHNAAGFSIVGNRADIQREIVAAVADAIDLAAGSVA